MTKAKLTALVESLRLTDEQKQLLLERVEKSDNRQLVKLEEELIFLERLQAFIEYRAQLPAQGRFYERLHRQAEKIIGEMAQKKIDSEEQAAREEIVKKIEKM